MLASGVPSPDAATFPRKQSNGAAQAAAGCVPPGTHLLAAGLPGGPSGRAGPPGGRACRPARRPGRRPPPGAAAAWRRRGGRAGMPGGAAGGGGMVGRGSGQGVGSGLQRRWRTHRLPSPPAAVWPQHVPPHLVQRGRALRVSVRHVCALLNQLSAALLVPHCRRQQEVLRRRRRRRQRWRGAPAALALAAFPMLLSTLLAALLLSVGAHGSGF